jgi:NADH-ubiquinone oxidoreductase chain 5
MEGPTPVSALIHAATMVTAGVFLIIRLSPLFEQTPFILLIIVLFGSLTAFFTSTIGLTQNDLKKVIAYSTCSQLGYMVMICGFSQYNSGLFHLVNHGFFKALLFLSAGSIIHALGDEQDVRKMGSMKIITPLTYICIFIGSISLMGLPFLTGFYSKDLILELIYGESYLTYALWLGLLAASLTAFYSFRLIYYTFISEVQGPIKLFNYSHEGS